MKYILSKCFYQKEIKERFTNNIHIFNLENFFISLNKKYF